MTSIAVRRPAVVACAVGILVVVAVAYSGLLSPNAAGGHKLGDDNFTAAYPHLRSIDLNSVSSLSALVESPHQSSNRQPLSLGAVDGALAAADAAAERHDEYEIAGGRAKWRRKQPAQLEKARHGEVALTALPEEPRRSVHRIKLQPLVEDTHTMSPQQQAAAAWFRADADTSYNNASAGVTVQPEDLALCPQPSPTLVGHMDQAVLLIAGLKENTVAESYPEVAGRSEWRPSECRARNRIAVVVPFRDRQSHLNRLLDYLIPMLQRQLLDFRFIVVEQYGKDLFNKGRIMNAAFELAELMRVDCVIFHDVDMFPQDDRNLYNCPQPDKPRHLGAYVNSLGYELWYKELVGGVLAMTVAQFRAVNGYSNSYWAWGGEDDDMGERILSMYTIDRPAQEVGRYTMLKHVKRVRTSPDNVYKLLRSTTERMHSDGLAQRQWRIVKVTKRPLYYHMYVDVGLPPDDWRQKS